MPLSSHALVLTPLGRDAEVAGAMLAEAGIEFEIATTLSEFAKKLKSGAGFAVLSQEAIERADLTNLKKHLDDQPEWSDFPFILLTNQGGGLERNPSSVRYIEALGNVTFLERPFHPTTFVSLAKSAQRVRLRQYEARHSLQTIQQNQDQLKVALAAANLGTWTVGLSTLQLHTSEECKRHYGREVGEAFSYGDLLASIHLDDWPAVRGEMKAAQEGGSEYSTEYRIVRPDGAVRWLQVRGRIDPIMAGRESTMSGVTLDVTDDRMAQIAVARSESRFRAAVEAVEGVLWTNSAKGEMTGEQTGWANLTGQSRNQYQGYGWAEAIHPDDAADTLSAWRLAVAEHRPFIFEHRVRRHDGTFGHYSIRAVPSYNADGTMQEWVGVHTDITKQRIAEKELSELAATLENRVKDATSSLREAEATLHQAQKLETIGQLTGGVAHDFNNLLTPIIASLEIFQRRSAGDERAAQLASAGLQSADRAKILVNRLLAFARQQVLEPKPTDVSDLVRGMEELLVRTIGPTVPIRLTLMSNLPPSLVDPNQLELAILNLCINARDAMPNGGTIDISISAEEVDDRTVYQMARGRYLKIGIGDTGCGMSEETLARAIEPFFTTKGVGKGTGLGLSMVHGLAAQLGGGMSIASRIGEGTTVYLYLPATEIKQGAPGQTLAPEVVQPTKPASILLVDDEDLVRFAVAEMLQERGYQVFQASSADEASQLVQAGLLPDALVTDQLMPGTKGSDLAKHLRELIPELPVLIATGYADVMDLGFPRIAKPFGADEIVERVRQLIEVG